jgi:acetoin utilization protein AcuB
MKNKIPLIKSVMTPFPYSVDVNTRLSVARKYMLEHGIHHLPVIDGEKIAGILDKDDLADDKKNPVVGTLHLKTPHVIDLNDRLDNILIFMADKRVETVLVTRNEKLVGIFSVTDACREFADYLREEFGPHDGSDAA